MLLHATWIAPEINPLLRSGLPPHKPEDNLEELFPGFSGDRVRLNFPMMSLGEMLRGRSCLQTNLISLILTLPCSTNEEFQHLEER